MMTAKSLFALSASSALLCASPALAADVYPGDFVAEAKQIAPSSNWALDYAQDGCRLARVFGAGDDQHLLYIEQAWPGAAFTLTLAGPALKRFRRGRTAYLGLQSDVPMRQFEVPPVGSLGDFGPAMILAAVRIDGGEGGEASRLQIGSQLEEGRQAPVSARLDPEQGAKIDRLVIRRRGNKALSFETGNLKAAFGALNTCTADLMKDWGLNPESHISYTPANWLNQDTIVRRIQRRFPSAALNKGEQAIVRMRVTIDEQGEIAECQIRAATKADALESPACGEMQNARFSPAIDASGNPMRSFYATTISYQISN